MTLLLSLLLLISTVHAGEVDQMAQALRDEGLNDKAVRVLLRHAKLECGYDDTIGLDSIKGIASKNGWNIWNATCKKTYKGKKRVAYEWENGRRVKKSWYVWDTPEEASREFIKFLRRRYRGALTAASEGDFKKYMRILRNKGYFGKD